MDTIPVIKKTIFLILLLSYQLHSPAQYCTSDDRFTEVDFFSASQTIEIKDIPYGHALDFEGVLDTILLDIYYPDTLIDSLRKRPAVMLMHGGGHRTGNKKAQKRQCRAFAKRGFVAISIGYRLGYDKSISNSDILARYRAHQDIHAPFIIG